MDFTAIDQQITALEQCLETTVEVDPNEELLVGVDLGTAYIVVVVLNGKKEPVACAMEFAQVVKDGLVVDYIGATRIVRKLVQELEERLGRPLTHAAIAVPPGTSENDCKTHRYVVEAAELEVTNILDEPTAANAVLGLQNGVIVDIGGGTTGLSVLEDGKVTYVADEATGGTHLTLVISGNYRVSFEEAEDLKKAKDRQKEILPVVRPVVQKMGTIVKDHIEGRDVSAVYLVGGTCCLKDIEKVMEKEIGVPVYKPANPFLVTPLGIALNCSA
ncbi:ethanolamine utilization protein EutJ [Desulfobaculum bizertense]|uniref:Ethanolamine utilization protein EutJ n=1 Tax=Desulfobaculum bizertense DSM 18034 TaxID=1121442 RepID=A0A1T4W4I3_9BACT|nr:ethanolamine utilization protein EutJ [Desulfobaculum bizertense]SKA72180.1 ethanolamine utilization protein EutJ [Desulfobaculum bizertense DSM 18034]